MVAVEAKLKPARTSARYEVSIQQYITYRQTGFLVVRNLVSQDEIAEIKQHTEDLMQGRLPEQLAMQSKTHHSSGGSVSVNEFGAPPAHLTPDEKAQFFLRIHMLHRKLEMHERYMLHPGVLDVLEVLMGPDVLALQTMLFLKPPGSAGQGWHQDSFYIPTMPDTLIGAWIAVDDCDERNGAMWFAKNSGSEPIYPPCPLDGVYGFGDRLVKDVHYLHSSSNPDDSQNALARVADKYDQVLCEAKAGDVVFFNGHVLHRSKLNFSKDRYRRSFVSHYCNARSATFWAEAEGPDIVGTPPKDPTTGMTNGSHILARGDSHLPFARPRFGTPCAALLSAAERRVQMDQAIHMIAANNDGMMGCAITSNDPTHDDDDETGTM